jgi:hypothetical protein
MTFTVCGYCGQQIYRDRPHVCTNYIITGDPPTHCMPTPVEERLAEVEEWITKIRIDIITLGKHLLDEKIGVSHCPRCGHSLVNELGLDSIKKKGEQ